MKISPRTQRTQRWAGAGRPHRGRGIESGSFILDRMGTVLGFDQGMESLTGWPATEVVGRHKKLGRFLDANERGGRRFVTLPLYEGELTIPESGSRREELRLHCSEGSTILAEALIERLAGPGERMLIKILRVLTRSAAQLRVEGLESRDELTGLLDRNSFTERLASEFDLALADVQPLALVMADVDHLRHVNDKLGHEQGNEVLRKLAGIMRVTFGEENRLGRLGEDTFASVLPGSGRGEARQLGASLRSTVERFRFFNRGSGQAAPQVTLSIGAASFPADADNARDLMDRAQEALEEARSFGRNRVWCYLRRPRVPLEVPVYFDAVESLLVGYTRDLSPSGIFVQTSAPIDIGMRCALIFPLPGHDGKVHVIGRVVRAVPPETNAEDIRIPGMGVEFERFGGPNDRRAIEAYLHQNESKTLRPENGLLSIS